MRKLFLIFMTLMACAWGAVAQNRTYQGQVVDAANQEPLLGATVMPVGGGKGTATDMDGKFTLSVPSSVKEVKISYVGYHTVTVPLSANMKVELRTSDQTLNEVMVVAFGTTTKEAFTGSAAVVDSKELQKRTTTNVADALVGSVPGLQMRGSSGAPGSTGKMNIRGLSSIYSNTEPLIIVDGAPFSASLSNIPQGDIESISVLKDAASAALYGARGASGVVIITTKKGKNKEAVVSVNTKWGQNSRAIQEYDVITDPGQYYEAYYAMARNYYFYGLGQSADVAHKNANNKTLADLKYNVFSYPEGEMLIGENGKLNPNATLGRKVMLGDQVRYLQPDNWLDEAYKNSLRQEYNMSINGGTDRSSFYASLNYLNDEGIIRPSGYERVNGRLRADYQAKKWLKVGGNISYNHSVSNGVPDAGTSLGAGNIMYATSMIAPIYPVYVRTLDKDGNPVIKMNDNGTKMYDYGVNTYLNGSRPFLSPGNPLGAQSIDKATTVGNQFNGTFSATVDFTDFLKLDVQSNAIWGESQYTYFGSPLNPLNSNVNGKLAKSNTTTLRTNNSQTLTFYKYFGDHYVNVLAGHEYYNTEQTYLYAYGEGCFNPSITELAAFANKSQGNATSYRDRYNVEGWFGSAQYNYKERYYGSASYRRDASSRFEKNHRWGNFWSLGGAWMISKEHFMESTRGWLDYLKLKASIGQQGNDNTASYAWTDRYNLTKTDDKTMSPVFTKGFGNPELTWETTTNSNFGFEFGFFDNRLTGSIDFYNKKTSDLLFWLSVPESTGGRGYYDNIGDIRNYGVELTLNGALIRTKDFEWSVSGNISHNRSKILSLPEGKIISNGGFYESPYWYEVGGEMNVRMDLAFAGLNEKGEALYYYDPALLEGTAMNTSKPGTLKSMDYVTTNTGEASRYISGCVMPKVYGGFGTNLRWKSFDCTATFDYQIGGRIYDSRYASLMAPVSSLTGQGAGSNFHKDWIKSWSPNNTQSDLPRWQLGDREGSMGSDRFLTNASYLNFQSFTIGYTVPKFWQEISKLRVYVAGENLIFWSARKGLDPRYAFSGTEPISVYSPVRTVSGGLELTF